jgi:hypothetical protein
MAQKVGNCKNLSRSARHKARNQGDRPVKIAQSRRNHLRNALRSCGSKFAQLLAEHYNRNPNPPAKHK